MADGQNQFVTPTHSEPDTDDFSGVLTWSLGSIQTVHWVTSLNNYHIDLFHRKPDVGADPVGTVYTAKGNGSGDQWIEWTVQSYGFDSEDFPVFFFWLNSFDPKGFTSNFFNITQQQVPSSSTSSTLSTSTTTAPPSSTTTTTESTAPTPSSRSFHKPESHSDLKVGTGVGVGLGIPFLLVASILIWILVRRSPVSSSANMNQHPTDDSHEWAEPPTRLNEPSNPPFEHYNASGKEQNAKPLEAPATREPAELGTS